MEILGGSVELISDADGSNNTINSSGSNKRAVVIINKADLPAQLTSNS